MVLETTTKRSPNKPRTNTSSLTNLPVINERLKPLESCIDKTKKTIRLGGSLSSPITSSKNSSLDAIDSLLKKGDKKIKLKDSSPKKKLLDTTPILNILQKQKSVTDAAGKKSEELKRKSSDNGNKDVVIKKIKLTSSKVSDVDTTKVSYSYKIHLATSKL